MKKLLILLFSIFFLSSPSVFAEDISDFQIEGMSIGDSLLDYMTEEEILKEIEKSLSANDHGYLNEPFKYIDVYLYKDFPTYEYVSVFVNINSTNQYVTNKNEKYTIQTIRGMIDYIEDIDGCIQKRDEIVEELSMMFPNEHKNEKTHSFKIDPSGKSMKYDVDFIFNSGDNIEVSCDNYEETYRIKNNWTEGLNVFIVTSEVLNWLKDY